MTEVAIMCWMVRTITPLRRSDNSEKNLFQCHLITTIPIWTAFGLNLALNGTQWIPWILSLGVKRSGREGDHSPTNSAEVKNAWSYISTPTISLHGVLLS
jgi:hypothetical protein